MVVKFEEPRSRVSRENHSDIVELEVSFSWLHALLLLRKYHLVTHVKAGRRRELAVEGDAALLGHVVLDQFLLEDGARVGVQDLVVRVGELGLELGCELIRDIGGSCR